MLQAQPDDWTRAENNEPEGELFEAWNQAEAAWKDWLLGLDSNQQPSG